MFEIKISGKPAKNSCLSSLSFAEATNIPHEKVMQIIHDLNDSHSFIPVYDARGGVRYYLIGEGADRRIIGERKKIEEKA